MYALRCKNAFLHQMHFGIKCIFASNAFCRFLTFCKQNVRAASLFFAKQKTQHFCIKCICNILLMLNILLRKMYAEHFPKENVRKNAFLHQMHFCIKCIFAKQNVRIKCILPLSNILVC